MSIAANELYACHQFKQKISYSVPQYVRFLQSFVSAVVTQQLNSRHLRMQNNISAFKQFLSFNLLI